MMSHSAPFLVSPYAHIEPTPRYIPGKNVTMYGGVFNASSGTPECITDSLEKVHGDYIEAPMPLPSLQAFPIYHISGNSYYGGPLFLHYGHFVTQTLGRIRGYSTTEHDFFVFSYDCKILRDPEDLSFLPKWATDIFLMLGLPLSRIRIASSHIVSSDTLVVRTSDWEIPARLSHEWFTEIATRVSCFFNMEMNTTSSRPESKKVFLSRTRYFRGLTAGEVYLENLLMINGYTILHPQELTIESFVRAANNCSIIIGLSGSALHNILFLPVKPLKVIQIFRDSGRTGMGVQRAIHEVGGIASREVLEILDQSGTGPSSVCQLDIEAIINIIQHETNQILTFSKYYNNSLSSQEFQDLISFLRLTSEARSNQYYILSSGDEQALERLLLLRQSATVYELLIMFLIRASRIDEAILYFRNLVNLCGCSGIYAAEIERISTLLKAKAE